MLDVDAAQRQLAEAGKAPAVAEPCALAQAVGRVLAADVTATLAMPPEDNSAMDGYAVRLADVAPERVLPVQQRCYAGQMPEPLAPGQAIRLFTGSVMPAGADAVIMQEDAVEDARGVRFTEMPRAGQHIRRQGEDVVLGSVLAQAGARLTAAHVAVLAAQGITQVPVWPRLRVGVLTTGDEIVPGGAAREPQQIFNSNAPMLTALLEGLGAQVALARHAADTEGDLARAFTELAAGCDLVISVGGVSVGEKDLVKPVLESLGGALALWKVRMKPGKPVALGQVAGKPVVCLPGNPVSAYAVMAILVSPLVRRMQGRASVFPPVRRAVLRTSKPFGEGRDNFLRVQADTDDEARLTVAPHAGQTSGIMSALPWAHGLARIPAHAQRGDGDVVDYYAFDDWLR
ncbi:molybdopterin molybdotransferase MoeA [Achromobacter sp. GG226]|uniref:molybdopterin molybdotransferase MoeA n=1 Tax=Verticiella alkaliphila TaxID=2779529 RepID=UPI001C0C32EA|nr:gephyrin-like molybdotransferase Glp [Verticiella sp. GG226]MBU4613095.1 molybdopterin molybdotransferase MoeA [Verticiella sp. GG226]